MTLTHFKILNETLQEGSKMFRSPNITRNGLLEKVIRECYLLLVGMPLSI